VVTGGNIGIGYETVKGLLRDPTIGVVVMASRSLDRAQQAAEQLAVELATEGVQVGPRLKCLPLDLESYDSVDAFGRLLQRLDINAVHILVCNAGMLPLSANIARTAAGHERTFAVNHLAHFLLILQLLPLLIAAQGARVVMVSSMVHQYGTLDFDDLNFQQSRRSLSARDLYAQSKLANILCAYELSRRYGHLGICANATHPGVVGTDILKEAHCCIRLLGPLFMRFIGRSPAAGAAGSLALSLSPAYEGVSGLYLDQERPNLSSPLTYDAATACRLWEASVELVEARRRVSFDFTAAAQLDASYPTPPRHLRPVRHIPWRLLLLLGLVVLLLVALFQYLFV
jgi:NAD(P)-dependent dehydrogenase (short-subunit alcohol dehydrogenase family)